MDRKRIRKKLVGNVASSQRQEWRRAEYIASLLERTLSPAAKVQHNVYLPVIGSPSRKPRQCDVVITYGEGPRTSMAIVEVQKRSRKPEITTFHGWVQKMRDVGAQQLICVSAQGYPQSIIDFVAERIGPTVKLMTLRDLREGENVKVLNVLPFVALSRGTFEIIMDRVDLPPHVRFTEEDKIFSIGADSTLLSLDDVIVRVLNSGGMHPPDPSVPFVTVDVELTFTDEHEIWMHMHGSRKKIRDWWFRVRVTFKTEHAKIEVSLSHLVYHQEMVGSALAWVSTMQTEVGGDKFTVHVVFKRDSDGILRGAAFAQPSHPPSGRASYQQLQCVIRPVSNGSGWAA